MGRRRWSAAVLALLFLLLLLASSGRPALAQHDEEYFLQVGAFAEEENALKLRSVLEEEGYAVSIREGELHRVQVRAGPDHEKADSLKEELQVRGFPVLTITRNGSTVDQLTEVDGNEHASSPKFIFAGIEIKAAVRELAYKAGEAVVFAGDLEGSVSAHFTYETFESALDEVLDGTPYRWIRKGNHYLVGNLETGPQFSALAESKLYKPQYRNPEEISDALSVLPAEISLLQGQLFIRALPQEMRTIEEMIARIDIKENPHQVQYSLQVVEINDQYRSRLGLKDLELTSEALGADLLRLIPRGLLLELAGPASFASAALDLWEERSGLRRLAEPSLVIELGSTGRLAVAHEELFHLEGPGRIEELTRGVEVQLTPRRMSSESGKILSEVELEVSGEARVETTLWGGVEPELIGVLNLAESREIQEGLRRAETDRKRHFALYLSARPVGTLPTLGNPRAVDMGGLGRLFPPPELRPPRRTDHVEAVVDTRQGPGIEGALQGEEDKGRMDFRLETRTPYFHIGFSSPVFADIRMGGRLILERGDLNFGFGLDERVEVTETLTLYGGYYPILYSVLEGTLRKEGPFLWLDGEYRGDRTLLALGYDGTGTNDYWTARIGYLLEDSTYLLLGTRTDFSGSESYYLGIRWE